MDYVDELDVDVEVDSGMESSASPLYGNSSKDDTPERKPIDNDDLSFNIDKPDPEGVTATLTPKVESEKPSSTTNKSPGPENPNKSMDNNTDTTVANVDDGNYDDEPDETLAERLWGLTEMFPDSVTNATSAVCSTTWNCVKGVYLFSRQATWIIATSSIILFAPVLFEVERAKMDEMQKTQQKQFLLGPNAAMHLGGAPAPPISR